MSFPRRRESAGSALDTRLRGHDTFLIADFRGMRLTSNPLIKQADDFLYFLVGFRLGFAGDRIFDAVAEVSFQNRLFDTAQSVRHH